MGNRQSKLFIAFSVSAFIITLVSLQVHQVVQAATAVPTITADGSPVIAMGTTGTFGNLHQAKLDSSQSVVLMADHDNGPFLASAAPYAFDKRTAGAGASMCSFDGNEASSPFASNIYCRRQGVVNFFLVFKYSDLSPVQEGGNNPLYAAAGTNLGTHGMLTVFESFMFVTSDQADSKLYRIDLSTLTHSGTVASTETAQDPSATGETYKYGICDSATFCYVFSENKKLVKFQRNNAGSPAHSSTLDLSQAGQLDSGLATCGFCGSVVLDVVGNNLLVATTGTVFNIAKISLTTFAYVSKVNLAGATFLVLCQNCFTAGIGGETYMMVISYVSPKDARFIKLSDMTEVTDAGTFLDVTGPADLAVTGWLTTTPGSAHGGIVSSNDEVRKLITTGVAPATITITSTYTTTTTTTKTTTTTTTPTKTTSATPSLPPTRTVIPTSTRTAILSSSVSTSITSIPSTSWSPSVLSASQSDTFPTKTFNITPSSSITHETPSLSNSKSDVLISRLIRDSISQAIQNFGMLVTGLNGGASATNARKIQAVVAMADCGKEDISDDEIPEIEPDSNPLTLRVGSRRFDTYRGSIVGASLFIFLWGILMFLIGWIRTKIEYGCSLKRALRKIGFPGTLSVPAFSLLPVAVNSASAMMMRYKSPGYEEDSTTDLTIIVFGFLSGILIPVLAIGWVVKRVRRHEKLEIPGVTVPAKDSSNSDSSSKKVAEDQKKKKKKKSRREENNEKDSDDDVDDELSVPRWKNWFDWLTEPRHEYKKTKFSQAWGPVFDFVTFPIFIILSFLLTVGMEVAEGASSLCSKGDKTCCHGGVLSIVALCALDTLLILFYKIPFLVRVEWVVLPICSIINVVMSALIYEMFLDSSSNERTLASGATVKKVGDQTVDLSSEKQLAMADGGASVVDHTDTLMLLSQISFYLAIFIGFVGVLNELVGAVYEWHVAHSAGQKKKLKHQFKAELEQELTLIKDMREQQKYQQLLQDKKNDRNKNNNNNDKNGSGENKKMKVSSTSPTPRQQQMNRYTGHRREIMMTPLDDDDDDQQDLLYSPPARKPQQQQERKSRRSRRTTTAQSNSPQSSSTTKKRTSALKKEEETAVQPKLLSANALHQLNKKLRKPGKEIVFEDPLL